MNGPKMDLSSPKFLSTAWAFSLVRTLEPFVYAYAMELVLTSLASHSRKLFRDQLDALIADCALHYPFKLLFYILLPHQQRIQNCWILRFQHGPHHQNPFHQLPFIESHSLIRCYRNMLKRVIAWNIKSYSYRAFLLSICWNYFAGLFVYADSKVRLPPLSFCSLNDINFILKNRPRNKLSDIRCCLFLKSNLSLRYPPPQIKWEPRHKLIKYLEIQSEKGLLWDVIFRLGLYLNYVP